MPFSLDIFSKFKSAIVGVVLISVIGFIGYKYYSLTSEISSLQYDKKELEEKKSSLEKDLALKEAQLVIKDSDITNLRSSIEKQNNEFSKLSVDHNKLNDLVLKLQHQEPSIIYIKKKEKTDCKDLEKTMEQIGALKYENL